MSTEPSLPPAQHHQSQQLEQLASASTHRGAFAQLAQAQRGGDPAEQEPGLRIDLAQSIGGVRGVVESNAPTVGFLCAYFLSGHHLGLAAGVAVGLALIATIARLVTHQSVQYALGGLFGVAVCALIVLWTGQMRNYFLMGLIINAVSCLGYLVSILVRWPLLGVIVGAIKGDATGWRQQRAYYRAYWWASWIWVGVFGVRLAVQGPLYLHNREAELGLIKLAMGVPLFAVAIAASALVIWLFTRKAAEDQPEGSAPALP